MSCSFQSLRCCCCYCREQPSVGPVIRRLRLKRGWGISRKGWLDRWRTEFPFIPLQRPQVCSPSLGVSFPVLCPVFCRKGQSCSLPVSWILHSLTHQNLTQHWPLAPRHSKALTLCLTDNFSMCKKRGKDLGMMSNSSTQRLRHKE